MSKKFFTLIYGEQIHAAPKTKIIPSESFSKLADASSVLEHIKEDAEKYRLQIAKECEEIKEHAENSGYEEGFKKWAEHLVKLEKEIEKVHKELQQLVLPVALKAAKKIVSKEIELSSDIILDIVANNLKAVTQHKHATIYVNKKDLDILDKNKPRLKEIFESLESLSIRPRDDVKPGGCIIETEIGIINAQLDHRWQVLEKAFESLVKVPVEQSPIEPPAQSS